MHIYAKIRFAVIVGFCCKLSANLRVRQTEGSTSCAQLQENLCALSQPLGVDLGGEASHDQSSLIAIAQAHHLSANNPQTLSRPLHTAAGSGAEGPC